MATPPLLQVSATSRHREMPTYQAVYSGRAYFYDSRPVGGREAPNDKVMLVSRVPTVHQPAVLSKNVSFSKLVFPCQYFQIKVAKLTRTLS